MSKAYVHGYDRRENIRLQDQASTLVELLHSDTSYPAGSRVLEAGCGVGAQTVTLAGNSPGALITSVDISLASVNEAKRKVAAAGFDNVHFEQGDIFALPHGPEAFDHIFVCFVLEHLPLPLEALRVLKRHLKRGAERSRSSKATTAPSIFIPTARRRTGRSSARLSCSGGTAATP